MSEFWILPRAVKVYLVLVVLAGAIVLAHSVFSLVVAPIGLQWVLLAGLTILTGSFSVKVPSLNAYLSVSEAFVFASLLMFGPAAGTVTVLLECLVILLWMQPQGRPLYRMFFNMAAPSVAIWTAGQSFFLFSGISPYSQLATPLSKLFLPLLMFTALYFLLNSWLVAIAVGLENRRSPFEIWWKSFAWLSVNFFSGASLAALIVTYARDLDLSTLALILPLLLVSYLTFRTAMGRLEDSYTHLAALNRLYFSTIETLAMAIDAKDQITHGHIRRVQFYAVGLAKHLGVSDQTLLSAIEAAALLHDMGKLAVPEYILNKPGKLTAAEFDKMKLHAAVGADILSAIDFPYPVVPIVRYHHENWDGTGYPSGIKGIDIPIGARILSVVDCFDALTSDRPYRQRLSDADAIDILIQRRGTMYDPLVVDTFLKVYKQIAPEHTVSLPTKAALAEIATSSAPSQHMDAILSQGPISTDGLLSLYEISQRLPERISLKDVAEIVGTHLRSVVPFSLFTVYEYDETCDELILKSAIGSIVPDIRSLRIPLGQRLSGWVAANRKTIVNSDAVLDLGDFAAANQPPLRGCLSTPLCFGRSLVGVITLYSTVKDAYTSDHRAILEMVAESVGSSFKSALEFDRATRPDVTTGLHSSARLRQLLEDLSAPETTRSFALVTIAVDDIERHDSSALDEVMRQIARHTQAVLRGTDLLFRCAAAQLTALLLPADAECAEAVAARIYERLQSVPSHRSATSLSFSVTVTISSDKTYHGSYSIGRGRPLGPHSESAPVTRGNLHET